MLSPGDSPQDMVGTFVTSAKGSRAGFWQSSWVDSLVPQGIEDPWKAAGNVAHPLVLTEPPGKAAGKTLPVSHSNGIDHQALL